MWFHPRSDLARRWAIGLVASLVALVGCRDDLMQPVRYAEAELTAALTEAAAQRLDGSGRFVLEHPISVEPEIDAERAREIARAFWVTYAGFVRNGVARERGAPLSSQLEVCPVAYYTESAYDPMPPSIPQVYRRTFGNTWIVGLCAAGEQQVAIAVAAAATGLEVSSQGILLNPEGGDVRVIGVPRGVSIPPSPEASAVRASQAIGTRIAGAPRLQRPGARFGPFSSVWRYPLEQVTEVEGDRSRMWRKVLTLSYGMFGSMRTLRALDGDLSVADGSRLEYFRGDASPTESWEYVVTRRADVPIRYEPVTRRTR